MSDNPNIQKAKKSLKHHIKLLESLKDHITKEEEPMLSRAMWVTWCLHRYINEKLIHDIEEAMKNGS